MIKFLIHFVKSRTMLPVFRNLVILTISFSLHANKLSAAVFTSSQSGNWNVSSTWGGAGVPGASDEVVISVGHTVTLVANTSISGAATINGTLDMATFNFTSGSLIGSGSVTASGSPVISTGGLNSTTTFSGTLGTGSFSLVVNGTGSLTLSGSNSFTGGITLNSTARLNINHTDALGTGALTLAGAGCRIDNTSGADLTLATNNVVNVNNSFTFIGTHNLTFGTGDVVFTTSRTITLSANSLRFNGQGVGNVSADYIITANGAGTTLAFNGFALTTSGATSRILTLTGTTNFLVNGAITNGTSSNSSLTYTGTASLTLSASNSFSGGITHNSTGKLNINHSNALGSGALTLLGYNCVIDNTSGSDLTLSTNNVVNVNNNFTFTGTNNLTFGTGDVVFGTSRIITITANTLRFNGQGAGNVSADYTITVSGTGTAIFNGFAITTSGTTSRILTLAGTSNIMVSGAITNGTSSSSSLTYTGTGSLTLSAGNTYTGTTTHNGTGKLNINHSNALSTGAFTLSGTNCVIDNTSGSNLTLATNNVVNVNNNFTFTGTHNLTFGTGNVIFNASRTITLNANTLKFNGQGQGNVTANYIITVNGPGNTIEFNGFAIVTTGAAARSLTLNGSGNVIINAAVTNGTVAGCPFLYSGTGVLQLLAAATYTGATTLSSGTCTLGATNALSTSSSVTVNGTLDVNGFSQSFTNLAGTTGTITSTTAGTVSLTLTNGSTSSYTGIIDQGSATFTVTKNGTAQLTLGGSNIYSGLTTVNAGTLLLTNSSALGNTTGATTVANGAVVSLSGGITLADNFTLAGTGISNGGVLMNVSGTNSITGDITYTTASRITSTAGTLTLGNLSATNLAMVLIGAGGIVIDGVVNIGNATLTLSASAGSALTLNSANTINNGLLLAANSRLNIGHAGALGSAAITLLGTIDNTSGGQLTLSTNNAVTISSNFTFAGTNNLNLGTGAVTISNSPTITLGGTSSTLTFGGTATNTIAGNIAITANGAGNTLAFTNFNISNSDTARTVTFQGTGTVSVEGIIANGGTATSGNVIKAGTGILELRGANTYTGTLTINVGIVRTFTASAFGDQLAANTVTVASGSSLEINNHNIVSTKSLTLNGNGVNDSGALRIMSGNCQIHAVNLLSASRIQVESGATYSAASSISGLFPLTLHVNGTMNMGSNIISTGSNTVLKTATGTLTYSVAQSHGNITVSDGRLELDVANAIPSTSGITVNSPGIVDMNGRSQSVLFIEGTGTITNNGLVATPTLTLNNASGATNEFSGSLEQGTATRINLIKNGTGRQILSGNNTYNGLTTVSAGALRASHSNALGTANLNPGTTITTGAALEISGNITISDTINLFGSGISSGGAIRNISGINTIVAPLLTTSTSQIRINSDADTLIFDPTATITIQPTLSIAYGGSGHIYCKGLLNLTTGLLVKDGTGTLTLGADNSYTGSTTISAGTLRLGHVRGVPPRSALTVGTSATFDINGFSPIIGSLAASVASAIVTSSTSGDLLLTVGTLNTNTTYAGTIQNGSATSISLRKTGTGTLTLSNAGSSYTGTTVVSNGTLTLTTGAVPATGSSPIGTNTAGVILGDTGTTAMNASPILSINSITIARNVTVADQPTTGTYTITNLSGSGTPTVSGQIVLNQPVTIGVISGRTININGGITSANAGEKTVTFDPAGTVSVSTGLITDGAGKLNILKTGLGTLTLSSALHTFSGWVAVNTGTLNAANVANAGVASSVGTGIPIDTIYIGSGATFTLASTVADTTNRTFKTNGNGATISTNSSLVNYFVNGNVLGDFSTILSPGLNATMIVGGVVSVGAITKTGAGTLRLDNTANNYTGSTTVSAGILRLGASGVIPNGSALINNATFELNGFNETLGSISGSGIIRNQSAATVSTLTCGGDNTSTTYSGIIQNGSTRALNLVKEGNGTLTLSNLNTYSGTTTINGGILKAAGMSVFGSNSAFTLADVAGVAIDITAFDQTIGSLAGGGTNGGNVILGAALLTTGGDGTSTTYSGVISGTGDITKTGSGVFTLSGNNTYTGVTTVGAGTLRAGTALAFPGGLALATGSVFNCNTFTSSAGFLLLSGAAQTPDTYGSTASAANVKNNTFFTAASTGILNVTGGLSAGYWLGTVSNNWHTAGNWAGNAVPDSTTEVFIQSSPTNQPIISASAVAKDVTIFAGATLSITGTNNITVSGNWNNHGTFTPNSSTVIFNSSSVQDAYNGNSSFFNMTQSGSGTVELYTNNVTPFTVTNELNQTGGGIIDLNSKNLTVGAVAGSGTIRTSAAERDTLTISGSINASGDYSGVIENGAGTVSVIRSGTGTVAFSGNNSFTGGVRISGGTLVAAHANALGLDTVFFSGGTLRCRSNSAINFNRPCIATANSTIIIDRETSGSGVTYTFGTLRINTASTLSLSGGSNVASGTAGITFGNMTYAAAATFTVNDPLSGGNTVFTFGAVSGAFAAVFNGNGDAIQTGRYETGAGGITYSGTGNLFLNYQNSFTGALTINSGNVTGSDSANAFGVGPLNMTGGRLTLLNDANIAFNRNLTYNGNAEIMLERKTAGAGITYTMGIFTCTSGNLAILNGTNNTSGTPIVAFGGTSVLNAGTILDVAANTRMQINQLNGNQSLTKNGAGELRILTNTGSRNATLAPNILNAGKLTLLAANALANADTANLTINGGILDLLSDANTSFNIRPIINGNADIQMSRVTLGGAMSHSVHALTIGNATLTVANGSNTSSGIGTLTVNGLFNLSGNATINTDCAVYLNGSASGTGSLTKSGAESLFQISSNPFTLPAAFTLSAGLIDINSPNFTVTGLTTVSAGTMNLNGATNIFSGGFTVNGGTIGTLTTSTLDITGNFIQTSGTFTPGTSTTVSVSGNLTRNGGTYTANGTLRMNGTTQQVSGSVNPITFANFTVATGSTTTLAQNIRMTTANLNIQTGATLDASTFTLNRSNAGGQLAIAGTLRLSGNSGGITGSNFPSNFTTFTVSPGTVVYERATGGQTIHSGYPYFNLVTGNTSGTQTVGGNITVNGTLTTTAGGTLNMGTSRLLGTFTSATHNGILRTQSLDSLPFPAGVNFTSGSSTGTITFDAAAAQTLPSNTTCHNLTLNNGNLTSLAGNATATGTLTFTSGSCALAAGNTFTFANQIGSSATNLIRSTPTSNITITGAGSNLFFDQTTPGTTNTLRNLTLQTGATAALSNTLNIASGSSFGTVTVASTATLNAAGNLTLLSDVNGSARVGTSLGSITGNVTVERFVKGPSAGNGRRWRFMSSPVQSATLLDLQQEIYVTGYGTGTTAGTTNSNGFDATYNNEPSVYWYNELDTGNLNNGWRAPTHIDSVLVPGIGYRVFVRGQRNDLTQLERNSTTTQTPVTTNLRGVLNQGNITIPVTFTSSSALSNDGWNLVGNPYASAIDWNAIHDAGRTGTGPFSGTNYTNIDPNVWVYNPATNTYDFFNALSNAGTLTSGQIPAGQSFWVKAAAASPSLTVTENHKIAGPAYGLFKTTPNSEAMIELVLDSANIDKMLLKYVDESTVMRDAYDTRKYNTSIYLASYGPDNIDLSLNCRPLNAQTDSIPLSVFVPFDGNYTLRFTNGTDISILDQVYLYDRYLNAIYDIKTNQNYTFSVNKNISSSFGRNRFVLLVSDSQIELPVPAKLISFTATATDKRSAELKWTTENEKNLNRVEIERSTDAGTYKTLTTVKPANSITPSSYTFEDVNPENTNYYRLKLISNDNTVLYSNVELVSFAQVTETDELQVYPVPVTQEDFITVKTQNNDRIVSVKVWNASGMLRAEISDVSEKELKLSCKDWDTGVYYMNINTAGGRSLTKKIIVLR